MKTIVVSLFAILASALIAVHADAGRLGGATRYLDRCGPARAMLVSEIFNGGERACVHVYGSDQSNLTVTVMNLEGRIVAQRTGAEGMIVEWYPEQTTTYRIVVTSQGEIESHVTVATN